VNKSSRDLTQILICVLGIIGNVHVLFHKFIQYLVPIIFVIVRTLVIHVEEHQQEIIKPLHVS
jgi:Na+-translocating ferredoxin:NAD+ oxidoreductase RnfD subunit